MNSQTGKRTQSLFVITFSVLSVSCSYESATLKQLLLNSFYFFSVIIIALSLLRKLVLLCVFYPPLNLMTIVMNHPVEY